MKVRLPVAVAVVAALAAIAAVSAFAHAEVSPPVALAGAAQVFTLAVPTEKESATTTAVALTVPDGFSIDSFAEVPGWKRQVQQTGSGENAVIQKVTWTAAGTEPGAGVPAGEDAIFQFLGLPGSAKTYTFQVEQTYSDGTVVDWSGAESSDTPAPTVEALGSLSGGGGDSTSTLAIVALVVGVIALVLGGIALVRGSGRNLA
jgi:uncharacterized protein YcnI